ncbi:MAG: sigma-54-dependent Fis family transcriptional regulator [Proteobacteria bacterium]|nr:sigma-54-dependent Fis family transcriptional regulator [Pseudomonadota bacterium]
MKAKAGVGVTSVLVVEDDRSSREALARALSEVGMEVAVAASGEEAIDHLGLSSVDVVVSDVMMGRVSGIDLLTHVEAHHPDTAVILVTGHGSIDAAVDAMRRGAYDYVTKPIDLDRLEFVVGRAHRRQSLLRENQDLRQELRRRFSVAGIIGQSAVMRQVLEQVEQVAGTNATVLISGESGTGKELVATAIHHNSGRAEARMVRVNCAALPESLIESELFGHERGAFTGAHRTRKGRFELADGGTMFLDEIGDLTLATQVKLLRAIQEREVERVGGQTPIHVDVRLIAASKHDLKQAMLAGRFRDDLYYRLNVVSVHIPPLRERPGDVPLLLDHFLALFCKEHGRGIRGFSAAARAKLMAYDWPGNVRELRNLVESLVVTARGDEITVQMLPDGVAPQREAPRFQLPMGRRLDQVERLYTLRTLELVGGNKSRAATMLGIGKKTLYRRLHQYGVEAGEEAPSGD